MVMSALRTSKASRFFAGSLLAGLLITGCSEDDPVDSKSLCAGESGVGLRVEGRAEPLDVCVSDTAVDALLSSENHYDVSAQLGLDDGSLVQVHIVFTQAPTVPVSLRLVSTSSEAQNDPGAAYVFYQEAPGGGTPIQSTLITGGSFRVTFNDEQVAVGTMENVTMDMTNVLTGDPAGERRIAEGFFSVSVTPPAAATSPSTLSTR